MARTAAIIAVACVLLAGLLTAALSKPSHSPIHHPNYTVLDPTTAKVEQLPEPTGPVYELPRVEDVRIDGLGEDWSDRGLHVDILANTSGKVQAQSDIDANARLAWNDEGLIALVNVTDDVPYEVANPLSGGDAVHLFVATAIGSSKTVHVAIGPGVDANNPELRVRVISTGPRAQVRTSAPSVQAARKTHEDGYSVETLIPWSQLGIDPQEGDEIAFQLEVDDADSDTQATKLCWYPSLRTARDSTKMHRLKLASTDAAVDPVRVAAYGDYPRLHRTRVTVLADKALDGKAVEICKPLGEGEDDSDRVVLKTEKLDPDFIRPELVSANLSLPMPERGHGYGTLDVWVDGVRQGVAELPDPGDVAKWEMPQQPFVFKPCVFSGRAFPDGDFEDAGYVEDLIGPYETKVAFYDGAWNPVTRADKPGRYGAVVSIHAEDGRRFRRYCTLFREPKDVSWRNAEMPMSVKLPAEFGISPAALKLQSSSVSDYFKDLLGSEGLNRDENTAVLLAGLYETQPGDRALIRNTPPARDRAWWAGLKQKLGEPVLPHLTYLPNGYERFPDQKWPLILFLHGKGERGDDLEQLKEAGLCQKLEYDAAFRKSLQAIVIAPQCAQDEWWSSHELAALLDETQTKYRIDADRIYVTGLSMGGYGTWALATEFPERFAAIAPCCGGGDLEEAGRLKDLPVWAFHGDADPVVPFWESERMVKALQARGDEAKLTVYPGGGHDAWTETYANPKLYAWLFSHRRSDRTSYARPAAVAVNASTRPARGARLAGGR